MENSFARVHPELVSEWSERNFPLTPEDITYGSKKLVWWRADCGHEWQARRGILSFSKFPISRMRMKLRSFRR
ncbi:MAG: zinc-ribbon domain-containing protein [Oscillospiraceae bacterium]|nr:zinc-ribbon domain-containing protein [Oscillospiraceae bacterium]